MVADYLSVLSFVVFVLCKAVPVISQYVVDVILCNPPAAHNGRRVFRSCRYYLAATVLRRRFIRAMPQAAASVKHSADSV